jgi:hypothetical protein
MTMHRQLSHIALIDAVGVDQNSDVISCFDPLTRFLTIAYRLDSTVADLVGTLTIKGGAEPDAATHTALAGAAVFPAALAGATLSNGVLTFATVGTGSKYAMIRVSDPPPYVSLAYDYTSGGGTNRLRVKAVY